MLSLTQFCSPASSCKCWHTWWQECCSAWEQDFFRSKINAKGEIKQFFVRRNHFLLERFELLSSQFPLPKCSCVWVFNFRWVRVSLFCLIILSVPHHLSVMTHESLPHWVWSIILITDRIEILHMLGDTMETKWPVFLTEELIEGILYRDGGRTIKFCI